MPICEKLFSSLGPVLLLCDPNSDSDKIQSLIWTPLQVCMVLPPPPSGPLNLVSSPSCSVVKLLCRRHSRSPRVPVKQSLATRCIGTTCKKNYISLSPELLASGNAIPPCPQPPPPPPTTFWRFGLYGYFLTRKSAEW